LDTEPTWLLGATASRVGIVGVVGSVRLDIEPIWLVGATASRVGKVGATAGEKSEIVTLALVGLTAVFTGTVGKEGTVRETEEGISIVGTSGAKVEKVGGVGKEILMSSGIVKSVVSIALSSAAIAACAVVKALEAYDFIVAIIPGVKTPASAIVTSYCCIGGI
jgi:hypothetical protein